MTHDGRMHIGPHARLIAITSAVLVIVGALSIGGVLAFGPLFPASQRPADGGPGVQEDQSLGL